LGERALDSEPAFDILAAFGYREIPRLKQRREVKLRRPPVNYRSGRIDLMELLDQMRYAGRPVRAICEVCLGQNDPIRERDLLQAFKMLVHGLFCSRHIDHANKTRKMEAACDHMVAQRHSRGSAWYQLIDDGGRIGETGGLNDHTGKTAIQFSLARFMQIEQRRSDIASGRAAHAPGRRHHHLALADTNKIVIDRDVPEFIDHHSGVAEFRMSKKVVEKRRFTGSKEA
jgi:hypothetical protein